VLPETLPPPLKAVPLGKVASPQAMTEGVIIGTPLSAKARRCGEGFFAHFAQKDGKYFSLPA
jgi:hypothetical protein